MSQQRNESDLNKGAGGDTARRAVRHPNRELTVFALCMSGICAPAARADVFASGANVTGSDVLSYSQFTGAPKFDMSVGLPVPNYTSGLAIGPDGNLYVANESQATVERFNPSTGKLIGTFVTAGSGLSVPLGMTFGPDGNLYVADFSAGVRQFNGTTGAPIAAITTGLPGTSLSPFDVKFANGNLYVSDDNSNTILQYNGSTLAFMGVFASPPVPSSIGSNTPYGMAFGPNGNLYAICGVNDGVDPAVNYIFEFDGTTGANVPLTSATFTRGVDLAFGQDGFIYVPVGDAILRYSAVLGNFQNIFTTDAWNGTSFIVFGGTGGIPPYVIFDPVSATPAQTLRITVIEGPVRVPPGVPVQAQLGFQNSEGVAVGPSTVVNLNPGQTASLDLNVSTLISSGRIELQPVVTALPGTPFGNLSGSAEIYNTSSGVGSVFYPGVPVPPASPIAGPPAFVPQGVVRGQSIQINALAPPDSPCAALLSFEDLNGNPVGPTQQVNLSPGTMASLSFNTNSLTKSGREEFVPQITPNNPSGAQAVASACLGSVEVYSQKTGETATYQTLLPAIGTSSALP